MPDVLPVPDSVADPLVMRLRQNAAAATGNGVAQIIGGVIVCLVTVGGFVVLIGLLIGWPGLGLEGWFVIVAGLFAGAAAVWLKRRESTLAGVAFTYVDPVQEWSSPGTFAGAMAIIGPLLDYLFIGPRLLIAGVHGGLDHEPLSRERFFDRCALLLRQLAKAGEAVNLPIVQIGEDETADKLRPVLNYLDRHDWIGRSSDGGRLWLSSRAKIDLPRLGVPVGVPEH